MNIRMKNIIKRADSAVPYIATLYYIEILYLMFFFNFLYGKYVSVVTGIFLSFMLTLHVIKLFHRKNLNRKIQLFIMDFHVAYSLAYLVNRLFSGHSLTCFDYTITTFRFTSASVELLMIYVLTDIIIQNEYRE
jgi:hypothetical protein